MGECCAIEKVEKDELKEEIRRDARVSEYESKAQESDFFFNLLTSSNREKVVFEVRDNPLIDYSKNILQIINLLRTHAEAALFFSQKYNLQSVMNDLILLNQRPKKMNWSSKKSRFISDYFQSPKNSFKSTKNRLEEIINKYKDDYKIVTFQVKSERNNEEACVSNLFKKLETEEVGLILNSNFSQCIIYSEIEGNFTFSETNAEQSKVTSYFFFFEELIKEEDYLAS